jgi:hypothetical protein
VPCKFPLHHGLSEEAEVWPAVAELGHQVPEGLLLHLGEDDLTHDAIRVLHHCLGDLRQDLHLALDPLKIGEQLAVDLLLRTGVQAVNEVDGHPRGVVGHFHGAHMEKAGQQGIADPFGVLTHFAGLLVGGAPLEHLQHLPGNPHEWLGLESDPADGPELCDLALERLDTGFARVTLEGFKSRDDA